MAHGFPIEVLAGLVRSGLAGAALEAPARLAMMETLPETPEQLRARVRAALLRRSA